MTTNKMGKIITIIEDKLNINITTIKGDQQIYGLICSLDKYSHQDLDKIITFIDEYSNLFSIDSIIEMLKHNTLFR